MLEVKTKCWTDTVRTQVNNCTMQATTNANWYGIRVETRRRRIEVLMMRLLEVIEVARGGGGDGGDARGSVLFT